MGQLVLNPHLAHGVTLLAPSGCLAKLALVDDKFDGLKTFGV